MIRRAALAFAAVSSVWAVLAALAVGAVVMALAGADPLAAYEVLFESVFLDYWGLADTLTKTCPLLLAGLAVALPLRAGLYNIGAEGQIYLGALFATVVGLNLPELPPVVGIAVCTLAGALGGGLWGLIPGYFKAARGIDEVVTTLLLNYVAINLVSYVVSGPLKEPGAPYPYSPELPDSLHLPPILPQTEAHFGLVVALVLVAATALMFRATTLGYALDVLGKAPRAAAYAGMPTVRHQALALAAGGAMAGIAGAYEVLGLKFRLYHLFSGGYGFDGLVVAFLAGGEMLWLPVAAFFLAAIKAGATMLKTAGVDATITLVLQGLIVMFAAVGLALRIAADRWRGAPPAAAPSLAAARPGEEAP